MVHCTLHRHHLVDWLVGIGGLFSWLVGWWALQLAGVGGLFSSLVGWWVIRLVVYKVGGLSSWLVLVGYSVSSLVGVGGL